MYAESSLAINMSGLNARLFPAPLPFPDAFQRPPAGVRTEALQGASPLPHDPLIAARPIAPMIEKMIL
jgi:hypothetical protein